MPTAVKLTEEEWRDLYEQEVKRLANKFKFMKEDIKSKVRRIMIGTTYEEKYDTLCEIAQFWEEGEDESTTEEQDKMFSKKYWRDMNHQISATHPEIEVKVDIQGAPLVAGGCVQQAGENIVGLTINVDTSRCEVAADGSYRGIPVISIQTTENSSFLHPDFKKEDITEISFPEYEGWSIWVSNIYTSNLAICLTKD